MQLFVLFSLNLLLLLVRATPSPAPSGTSAEQGGAAPSLSRPPTLQRTNSDASVFHESFGASSPSHSIDSCPGTVNLMNLNDQLSQLQQPITFKVPMRTPLMQSMQKDLNDIASHFENFPLASELKAKKSGMFGKKFSVKVYLEHFQFTTPRTISYSPEGATNSDTMRFKGSLSDPLVCYTYFCKFNFYFCINFSRQTIHMHLNVEIKQTPMKIGSKLSCRSCMFETCLLLYFFIFTWYFNHVGKFWKGCEAKNIKMSIPLQLNNVAFEGLMTLLIKSSAGTELTKLGELFGKPVDTIFASLDYIHLPFINFFFDTSKFTAGQIVVNDQDGVDKATVESLKKSTVTFMDSSAMNQFLSGLLVNTAQNAYNKFLSTRFHGEAPRCLSLH
jgi:hypothetical protein